MRHLQNQSGLAMVMELLIVAVVISFISLVAIRVQDARNSNAAQRVCRTVAGRQYCYNAPSTTGTAGNSSSSTSTASGSGANCTITVNGQTTTYYSSNGQCSASSGSTSSSSSSSPSTPGVNNTTTTVTQGQPGAPGKASCTVVNSDGTTTTKTDGSPCVAY